MYALVYPGRAAGPELGPRARAPDPGPGAPGPRPRAPAPAPGPGPKERHPPEWKVDPTLLPESVTKAYKNGLTYQ